MKIPDNVNICGHTYKVKITNEPGHCGGSGDTCKQLITVNNGGHSKSRLYETFIHEVMECIACERGLHYESHRGDIKIMMSHKEFDVYSADVARAIEK
jgi:hypothetical protein